MKVERRMCVSGINLYFFSGASVGCNMMNCKHLEQEEKKET